MKPFFLIVIALSLSSTSCALWKKTAEQAQPLTETIWRLTELSGSAVSVATEHTTAGDAYIVFSGEEGRFSGFAGCNRFSGSYELSGANKITLPQIIVTRMFCADMEVENQLLPLLSFVTQYRISGDSLVLLNAKNEVLVRFENKNHTPQK